MYIRFRSPEESESENTTSGVDPVTEVYPDPSGYQGEQSYPLYCPYLSGLAIELER